MTTPDFSAKLGQRAAPNLLISKRAPAAIRSALTFIAQLRENVVAHEKTPNVLKEKLLKCGEGERGSIFPIAMSPSRTMGSNTDQSVAWTLWRVRRHGARIGASERKGVAPRMIFVMRDGSLSPLRNFHLDNLG